MYRPITGDDTRDWDARIDGGQIVWWRETGVTDQRALMLFDGASTSQIATIAADDYLIVKLDIDNGWVFWEDQDDDLDQEKWVYNVATGETTRITTDEYEDYSYYKFENGRVLWFRKDHTDENVIHLMFFNGTETVLLDDTWDPYKQEWAFVDGCVVWEHGNPPFGDVYLYDGTETINLSGLSGASGYSIQKLGEKHAERCTQDGDVVWEVHDGDWEILRYDGATVTKVTDNTVHDNSPQVFGGQVAWHSGSSLWLHDGETITLVSDDIYTTSINYYLHGGGLIWWCPEPDYKSSMMLYEPSEGASVLLQDGTVGYDYFSLEGFDDKGVLWYIRYPTDGASSYTLKLYHNGQVKELVTAVDPLDGTTWYFERSIFYQGGYVAWNQYVENTVTCDRRVCDPDCHTVVDTGPFLDREAFYYDELTGEVRRITGDGILHKTEVTDMDGGLVVWSGDSVPPPNPGCPSGDADVVYHYQRDIYPKFTRNLSVSGRLLRDSGSEGVKA